MFKRTRVAVATALVAGWAVQTPALAQETQRIEITGSAIKRTDAETALPVTVINIQELQRQGVVTVEQVLQRLASNQSNYGVSASVGGTTGGKAEADLRGLSGPLGTNANKTLVLLNGRRLANHSFDAAAVDLNAIPLAAVQRVEVLRDGASALYGTDAIGGVINFVLRRDFTGVEVSATLQRPEAGKGGETARAGIVAGFGSLASDRFNLLAAFDYRKQKVLEAVERSFGSTGVLGPNRADITAGTSGTAFPGDLDGFEPSGPNCDPPFAIPRNTTATNGGAFESCRYDFTRSIDLIPENEQMTGLIRASFALGSSHTLAAELMHSKTQGTSRVAPAPTSHLMLASSPFFPAGAATRDIDPLIPFFGVTDPNPGGPTLGGSANWRQVPAGKRTSGDETITERGMIEADGTFGRFDYKASIGQSRNKSTASVSRGYVNDQMMQDGVWAGVINPFGTHGDPNFGQTAAGLAAIEAAQVVADTVIGKSTVNFADARFSTELFKMGAGAAAAAFGFERRSEKSTYEATPITAELGSLGIDPNSDVSGKRDVTAVFAEFSLPLLRTLEVTLAGRYDRYSDFGNTFNPKIGFKFTPIAQLAVRGSANKGFRAPTLYEIYQPQSLTFTSDNYDDPTLCPGGTPVAGTSAGVVCGQQVLQRTAGPAGAGRPVSSLEPEKSRSYSLGLVLEPMRNLSFTADYWSLKIKNLINGLPEQAVFGDPTKYAAKFVRCSTVAAGSVPGIALGDIDACANLSATQDPIAFIDTPIENLGEMQASGVDISANWRSNPSGFGVFSINAEGTYITKFDYQRERGGTRINAVAQYVDSAPVFRWQHVITAGWSMGSWSAALSQRMKSKYLDQDGASVVGSYEIYDASVTFSGIKGLAVSLGVKNLADRDPPRTAQVTTFQRGYDPRFTDPLGRTFVVGASYKFF